MLGQSPCIAPGKVIFSLTINTNLNINDDNDDSGDDNDDGYYMQYQMPKVKSSNWTFKHKSSTACYFLLALIRTFKYHMLICFILRCSIIYLTIACLTNPFAVDKACVIEAECPGFDRGYGLVETHHHLSRPLPSVLTSNLSKISLPATY